MDKLIMGLMFLSANFIYQYTQITPNYYVAAERCYFQVIAMLFIVFYPKIVMKFKPKRK